MRNWQDSGGLDQGGSFVGGDSSLLAEHGVWAGSTAQGHSRYPLATRLLGNSIWIRMPRAAAGSRCAYGRAWSDAVSGCADRSDGTYVLQVELAIRVACRSRRGACRGRAPSGRPGRCEFLWRSGERLSIRGRARRWRGDEGGFVTAVVEGAVPDRTDLRRLVVDRSVDHEHAADSVAGQRSQSQFHTPRAISSAS